MNAWLTPVLLVSALAVTAFGGPTVLRYAAPVLSRTPRLAVFVVGTAATVWMIAGLAVGPVIAWGTTGPALLSGGPADTCQRCLAAASPFDGSPAATIVPTVLLLAVPALIAAAFAGFAIRRGLRRHRRTRRTAERVRASTFVGTVAERQVLVSPDLAPVAFSLPSRHGGVVISSGALSALRRDEIDAVLAHEWGHVRQRHHMVAAAVEVLITPLRSVPLMAAAAVAIPRYLEIAADDTARRQVGSTALAAALLKLGAAPSRGPHTVGGLAASTALLANGPDRIGHLIDPAPATAGAHGAVAASVTVTTALAIGGGAVHASYALAAFAGCT